MKPSASSGTYERPGPFTRRTLLSGAASLLTGLAHARPASRPPARPNIVLIVADDLGWGDLSCQGHPLIRTPNIDRLAAAGQRWTSFCASAPLCNPSRAALLTGRMPVRIHGGLRNKWADLPNTEVTLAEMLKPAGYVTAYVGKWGLCRAFDYPGAHPNDQGFDEFFGLAGSNDAPLRPGLIRTYDTIRRASSDDFEISLYRQREAIETPVHQPTLTKRYTHESTQWILRQAARSKPFLLFLSHTMPHVPLFRSRDFEGRSRAGLYGDAVEELDWSVGQVMAALRQARVENNTLVIFTSDNGPWRTYYDLGGSSGPFRDGKMTAWEGGFRVPGIFAWPGVIAPAVIDGIGANVDLPATLAALARISLPEGRTYDSIDLSRTLLRGEPSPRQEWFYYGDSGALWAYRQGDFKLHLESKESLGPEETHKRGYGNAARHAPPLLFNLSTDVSERRNIAASRPDIVRKILNAVERHNASITPQP